MAEASLGGGLFATPLYARMNLYKYTTINNAIRILSSGSLRYTQPLSFNDPFDSSPFVLKLYSNEELKTMMDIAFSNKPAVESVILNSFYETLSKIYPNPESTFRKEDLLNLFYSNIEKDYGTVSNFVYSTINSVELLEKTLNNFTHNVLTKSGVLCLTTDPKNLLMWAHYGDSHKGILFEFDGNHSFFNQSDNDIYPTKIETVYTNKRPKIDFRFDELSDSEKLFEGFKSIYFTKSNDWKYEAEYRVVRRLTDETNSGDKDINGFDVHLFQFPKEILKGIIFGNKTSNTNIDLIKNILSEKKYLDISFQKVELDETEYLLHIK